MIREINCYFACVDTHTPSHTPKVKTITVLISVHLDRVYIYVLGMAGQRIQLLCHPHTT